MKILLLCNKSPFPAREGGPIAMNMIIEGLIGAGHEVKVLAINSNKYNVNPEDIPYDYRMKTGIELVYVDLSIRPAAAFLNLFSSQSFHVERFISSDFEKALTRILQSENFDIIQLEMLYMSPYVQVIRRYSDAKVVLRAHNIEHVIWQRLAMVSRNPLKKWYLNHLVAKLKKYEISSVGLFDGIAAITREDAGFFMSLSEKNTESESQVRVANIPFGIDPVKFPEKQTDRAFPSVFSLGAMDWIPNLEGVIWFLKEVWPLLHEKFPDLKYYIAGRQMPGWLKGKQIPGVEVVGEVDNAEDFIRSRSILVVPLFSGSGIRIKIIEGMALGTAIVSTTVGAEGISCTPGLDILIADSSTEFIEMISLCIESKKVTEQLGRNARELALTRYNRDRIISDLIAFYQNIRGE